MQNLSFNSFDFHSILLLELVFMGHYNNAHLC